MRFIQISDTHIGASPDFENYGHSSLRNLETMVDVINGLTFAPDFILHCGDVVEDGSEAAYQLAKVVLERLKYPVYYVNGNHDDRTKLQQILLGTKPISDRFDYAFEYSGIHIQVFDTYGPNFPTGTMTTEQLNRLDEICCPDGPPLLIAIHHQPVPLDVQWIDGWMWMDCHEEFRTRVASARNRIVGIFFGHVHRAFKVLNNGILYCSAPSGFAQLLSWPDLDKPQPTPDELGGFNIVTVSLGQTTIRQHYFGRPH
jgi:Icc protein